MNRIQQYFNSISKSIAANYETAGASTHRPDIGQNRERIMVEFLEKHLPKRLTPTIGGQVIGTDGSESKQVDILVSSDISIRFDQNERTFVTAESLAGAISVKSKLDKPALEDCLLNIASIPQIDSRVLLMPDVTPDQYKRFLQLHPHFYVFAYDGMVGRTCFEQVMDFYKNHPEIPKNRYIDTIIVNGSYTVHYCKRETPLQSGGMVQAGSFVGDDLEASQVGYPFCQLLQGLMAYVTWMPKMSISVSEYINAGYDDAFKDGYANRKQ